ncbi:class I adenylate-forming enzyme family protein, partial [Henriciella aquimarina]|uniref:class I adenylate-forming enzyme family protein n=1 Tax=Henriciella aquimarina TaxID=545261 RepID=UPI0009FCBFFF
LQAFLAHCEVGGEAIAIRYFDRLISYGELDEMSSHFAAWLIRSGAVQGDRIFILLQNVPQFAIAALGAWKAGLIPVLGNPMYRQDELGKLMADCEPSVILCHPSQRPAFEAVAGERTILTTTAGAMQSRGDPRSIPADEPDETDAFMAILGTQAHEGSLCERITSDPALLLYTSGTTGVPKGAMLTASNLSYNAAVAQRWFAVDGDARLLSIAPLFHITGFSLNLCLALSAGASLILTHRFRPDVVMDAIREWKPTFTVGASTAFIALMNEPGVSPADFDSFHSIYSGGAPISPSLATRFEEELGHRLHTSFGMTETTAQTHLAPFEADIPVDPETGALAIGVPVCGVDARIVDKDGKPCGLREPGELLVRGPQVMTGYWRKPEETAETLADGWMHTGDIGLMDEAGWFYLVDRKKNMISASGFKVWPREVEDVLYRHEAVREAAIVGAPDEYRGETVHAFVSLRAGQAVTEAALIAFVRERLAAYKCPRKIHFVDELPKTPSGKIMHYQLADRLK